MATGIGFGAGIRVAGVFAAALLLAACGRYGALEPAPGSPAALAKAQPKPGPSVPGVIAPPVSSDAGVTSTPSSTMDAATATPARGSNKSPKPDRPFILDGLL